MSSAPLSVAVVSRKGGAGKSTTAFNVAGALAADGRRVLVVDMDPQASITGVLLGHRPEHGSSGALANPRALLADLIVPCGEGLFPTIFLAPGDRGIEQAASQLSEIASGFFRLRRLLAPVDDVDVVLIDTPPALGFAISSSLLAAQLAVVPMLTGQHDLDALVDTVNLIKDQENLGGGRLAAVVPCAVRPRELHDRGALELLTDNFGDLVAQPIPYSPRVRESMAARTPIGTYEPRSAAAEAYQDLAGRLLREGAVHA